MTPPFSISSELDCVLTEYEFKMKDDVTLQGYQKALAEFKRMIGSGITTPRGNQLRSIEEGYIANVEPFGPKAT
jgi:hypothetical protein